MTLRLILTRHAKSSWEDPFQDDHSRPLNARGRQGAPLIGGWLRERGYAPDVVLCSDSARTQETWMLLNHALQSNAALSILPALYHAAPNEIARLVGMQNARTVMVIAHNPGIGHLACGLAQERPDNPYFGKYPTSATAVLEIKGDTWSTLTPRSARVLDFVTPHSLMP
ncbi:MAG: SixA phosphatase family protein [Halocynthiibacter sp.]